MICNQLPSVLHRQGLLSLSTAQKGSPSLETGDLLHVTCGLREPFYPQPLIRRCLQQSVSGRQLSRLFRYARRNQLHAESEVSPPAQNDGNTWELVLLQWALLAY